ncbi:unnamed protein product [Effrenium voratum]|nr:unnamed protein product [Effrenium voratum]
MPRWHAYCQSCRLVLPARSFASGAQRLCRRCEETCACAHCGRRVPLSEFLERELQKPAQELRATFLAVESWIL